MNSTLAQRVQHINPSPTLAIAALAAKLRTEGRDVIGLGAGEPDFDTPEHIKIAAIEAIHAGKTKYTPVDGTPELKTAIINKFARDNGLHYEANQILVSCGAKQGYFNLVQALINDGDEVIIPAPYWVSYPDMVLLAGGNPAIITTGKEQCFKITAEQLTASITPRTRLVTLNSPSNPTGATYTEDELKDLAEVFLKHPQLFIITDDIYEHILFEGTKFHNILTVCPDLQDRCIVLNGVSKAYSMTGWRIGYTAGPHWLIAAMKKIQSQSTSNPSSISQAAAVAALEGDQSCINNMLQAFAKRHSYVVNRLNQIEGFDCMPSTGTFYCFPNVETVIRNLGVADDTELSTLLLDQADVTLIPGTAFGAPGYLRLSFATSMENLTTAMDRIQNLIAVSAASQ